MVRTATDSDYDGDTAHKMKITVMTKYFMIIHMIVILEICSDVTVMSTFSCPLDISIGGGFINMLIIVHPALMRQ